MLFAFQSKSCCIIVFVTWVILLLVVKSFFISGKAEIGSNHDLQFNHTGEDLNDAKHARMFVWFNSRQLLLNFITRGLALWTVQATCYLRSVD